MWTLKSVEMQFNLPFCAGTRCRRHTELPAKQHTRRTQQTPGTHWETPSLRERDGEETGRDTQRPILVQIHTKQSSTPRFRGIYRCNQRRQPVMCTLFLFPSSQHSSLSALSSVSHPEESGSQSGENWQEGTETAPRSCSLHVSIEAHVSDRDNTRGPGGTQLAASVFSLRS